MTMTNEEAIARIRNHKIAYKMHEPRAIYIPEALDVAVEALENIEEIAEIIKSDIDAETKCKMISNILTAKPHYFKELVRSK